MSTGIDVDAARAQTPGVAHRIHFNNAGAGLLTQRTLDAMVGHLELEATIGGYEAEAARQPEIRAVYASLGRLLNARPDEIALFDNSTHAFNAAFYSLPMRAGDRILTCRAEYGSNVLAYFQRAQRDGVDVVVVPDDDSGQVDVDALADLIDERTRLIGISHVPTGGGLVNPAERIGAVARAAGMPFLLDATQSVGQLELDVRAVGADFVTGTGRKFLRGPRGIGFLWVGTESLDLLDPFVNEIEASTWDGARGYRWHDGAQRLETWERSYSNVLGLGAAVDQALEWGMSAIEERVVSLGARLRDGLASIPGVTTYDLGQRRCAIVTAGVDGVPASEVSRLLRGAAINTSVSDGDQNQFDQEVRPVHPLVRLSPHYYNTEDEIDRTIEVMTDLTSRSVR
jgi:selenocysteine lyase/cysteine desulfurase